LNTTHYQHREYAMHCIHSSYYGECFIEEPCVGKPQARFRGGGCDGKH